MPIFGALIAAIILATLFSLITVLLSIVTFRRLSTPKPRERYIELVLLSLPLLASAVAWVYVLQP